MFREEKPKHSNKTLGRGLTPTANNYDIRRETFNSYKEKIGGKPVADPDIQYYAISEHQIIV